MLSTTQINTLFVLHKRNDSSPFSQLPFEIIKLISKQPVPDAAYAKALKHVADGNQQEVIMILNSYPHFIFYSDSVITRSGLKIANTSLLECALGAGDHELAETIMSYFAKFEGGEAEKIRQLERYRPHIQNMLNTTTDDITSLLYTVISSPPQEITAACNNKLNASHECFVALQQFRRKIIPATLTKSGMHFQYANLITILNTANLLDLSNQDIAKLIYINVWGYLLRGLPAIDRFAITSGLMRSIFSNKLIRTTTFSDDPTLVFLDTANNKDDQQGLGFDYAYQICPGDNRRFYRSLLPLFTTYLNKKQQKLCALLPKNSLALHPKMTRSHK